MYVPGLRIPCIALPLLLAACATSAPQPQGAQRPPRSGGDRVFIGVVRQMPQGGEGLWMVGTETFETNVITQIETFEAGMALGSCAAVTARGNQAIRIVLLERHRC